MISKKSHLFRIESSGRTDHVASCNSVRGVSSFDKSSVWAIPTGEKSSLLHSEDGGVHWKTVLLSDLSVSKISCMNDGSCLVLTPQGAIYHVLKTGQHRRVFDDKTAHDLSVSPDGILWMISQQKKQGGGNRIFWCGIDNYTLQPVYGDPVAKKISARSNGSASIVTIGGEVASIYVNRMGGLETPGGELFAKDISCSIHSNTIWIISSKAIGGKRRNVLKFWNPDIDKYMDWHSIPDVEPVFIAGAD